MTTEYDQERYEASFNLVSSLLSNGSLYGSELISELSSLYGTKYAKLFIQAMISASYIIQEPKIPTSVYDPPELVMSKATIH